MKNLNLIKGLWDDSHEKRTPQRLRRYAVMLLMLLTLGVGQMWASMGFENSNNGVKFTRTPLGGASGTWNESHGRTRDDVDLGNVTALTLKEWYCKFYQNEDNMCGEAEFYYRVYLKDGTPGGFTKVSKSYFNWNSWSSGWRYPTAGNNNINSGSGTNILSGLGSGIYYFEYYFQNLVKGKNGDYSSCNLTIYCANDSKNFKDKFTIKPNALTSFSVSRSGYSAGTGTSDDPYIIARGGSLTLTASGSGGTSDANSTIKYKYGSSGWQTTSYTISDITSTTKQSITVKGARRHNSQDLGSDESSVTIYYQAETTYSVSISSGSPSSVLAGANYTTPTITASNVTGYHFDHWSISGSAAVASTTTSPTTVTATSSGATITANYEPNTYNITLNKNGGDDDGEATITYLTTSFASHTAPEKEGYTVEGYYTNDATPVQIADANGNLLANKTGYTNASSQWTKTSDATLYAHWKQTYSVTYYANYPDGVATSGSVPTDANEYASGATVTVKSNSGSLAATGYTFTGWNTAPGGGGTSYAATGSATFSISGNTPLYAQWTENITAVTISASPAGTGTFTVNSVSGTSASVGVTTTATVVATPATDFQFTSWATTNCSVSPTNNASTTLTGNGSSATGTLTATFTENVASGWYLGGTDFGNSWATSNTAYPLTKKYRGMEGVFYRVGTVTTSGYDCLHNGSVRYRPSTENPKFAGAGWSNRISLNSTTANSNYMFKTAGTYYIIADTRGATPVIWYETSEPDRFNYHSVNVTGVENAKGTCKVTLGSTSGFETTRFANGETFYVTITGVSGYIPTITIGGTPTTWWKEQATYTASGTMSTSDIAVTISYTPTRAVRFAKTTGCETLTATGPSSTSVSDNTKIKDGTVITFHQENSTGYSFSKWYSNNTGTSGTEYSTVDDDFELTVSSTRYTIYPIYTENMTTVNLVASPSGKGTFSSGGNAVTSVSAGVTTHPSVTAVPATGYRVNTSATVWSESSDYISLSSTTTNPTTITATGTSGNSATLTATFTPHTYQVQFHRNGGAGDVVYQDFTYDAAQDLTANTYTKTGYNFAGWALAADAAVTYADEANVSNLTSTNNGTFHLYAKWTPKTATISYSQSGTGYSTGGQSTTKTATYDAAMPTPISTPTAANGYAFMGYYDALEPLGTQYYNADGTSARTWDKEDATATLYAYFKKAEITELTLAAAIVGTAETDSITVTPTISPTPTGTTKVCWDIQYSNGTSLPSQPEGRIVSGNTYRFKAPTASATYRIVATLRTGSACDGGDELSTNSTTFQVAGEHSVTVRYQDSDGRTLKASTEVTARPLAWTEDGDITPPTITGYKFDHWDAGDGVTIKNGESDPVTTSTTSSIQIQAVYDGTLTAVYSKKRMIYFNNTLGWGSVYVYFYKNDSYWQTVSPYNGSGANTTYTWTNTPYSEGLHGQMQPISEGSNIYYFDAEAAGVNASYDDVVFTEADQHGEGYFKDTKAVRRGDYKTSLPMFVPVEQTPEVHNKTDYYNKGYWMNYPENTGYVLHVYAGTGYGTSDQLQEIPFEFTEDMTLPMSVNVELNAGVTYGFEIHRADGTKLGENEYTLVSGNSGDEEQTVRTLGESERSKITTAVAGDYTFKLNYGKVSSDYHYLIGVHYPVTTGDYRILYTDDATWSMGAHSPEYVWWHASRTIHKENGAEDIVSFYVKYDSDTKMKFQYASSINASTGAVTWTDVTSGNIDLSSIKKDGVYNFYLTQADGGISVSKIEPYTGKYYIRTDCAGATKWENFRTTDHEMTYSDYTETNHGYSHYYPHWVEATKNVKFCIANDYSPCITDTLVGDYGTVIANIDAGGYLQNYGANIRFMWNQSTNKIWRAYIGGSSNISDRFLVLEGDAKMFDAAGNALTGVNQDHRIQGEEDTYLGTDNQVILYDDQNFVYEREIKVQTGARAKLTAKYNGNVQYFVGGASETEELLGGEESVTKNKMRIVYDFKTNRLVTAYMPEGDITEALAINADIMLVREHQEAGQQLVFKGDGALSKVKTVYGVMRFNRWTLNNKETTGEHSPVGDPKSAYERGLYWISFPFNVNLSDVFGFGTYGTHWIIMEYDGAERAQKGYWKDSEGFWKYVLDRSDKVLEAGKGYVLALDLDLMRYDDDSFWSNNIEQVELFFPSVEAVENIEATDVQTSVEEHACTIDRTNNGGADINKNRTRADSHWNIIGIPSYANYGETLKAGAEGKVITWNSSPYTNDLPFLYEWSAVDNTYSVQSGTTYPFKAMHAYMVQYHGDLYWSLASATPPSSIVARRTYAEKPQNVEMRIELQQNEKVVDQTFVKLSNDENVSTNFAFDEDLCKEYNANKANIYTIVENYLPVAGNTMPMSDQTTVVPVGVKIATDGEYTFAIPDGTEGIGVVLIDNIAGTRTNLGLMDYSVTLEQGQIDNRFLLEISPIVQSPTDLENTEYRTQNTEVRKVMIDGILYIVKDGIVYDAQGHRVQ